MALDSMYPTVCKSLILALSWNSFITTCNSLPTYYKMYNSNVSLHVYQPHPLTFCHLRDSEDPTLYRAETFSKKKTKNEPLPLSKSGGPSHLKNTKGIEVCD